MCAKFQPMDGLRYEFRFGGVDEGLGRGWSGAGSIRELGEWGNELKFL